MGGAIAAIEAVVGRRTEQVAIAPGNRAEYFCPGILCLDRTGVVHGALPDLVIGQRLRMDVPMGRIPQHRFVVECVVANAAVTRVAESLLQMGDPAGLRLRRGRVGGVERVIADDESAGVAVSGLVLRRIAGAVAGVGRAPGRRVGAKVAAFGDQLRAILDDRVAPALLLHRLRHPADRAQGQQGLRTGRERARHQGLDRRGRGVPLPSGMFMKNQSDAVLWMSACQLYRVVELPPQRTSG